MLISTIVTLCVFAIALFTGMVDTITASITATLVGIACFNITQTKGESAMMINTKATGMLNALNSRTVGYVWLVLSILLISMGTAAGTLVTGGISLGMCLMICIISQGTTHTWSNRRLHGWDHGAYTTDDSAISEGIMLGFVVSLSYYLVMYVVAHSVWGLFNTVLPGYVVVASIVGLFTSKKIAAWAKALPLLLVVLVVGCSDAEHGMRMKALNDDGYPGYCQRDTDHDGWYTLEEGGAVLYKDLGPCPTCKAAGIVPVYNSTTDTTWSADAQWNKQELEALELESIQFPYHVCDMDAKEWDSYRLMKWDYESTIWWRGTLLGLEKMTHPEVQATEECTSRKVKKSGMDNWFIAFLLVGLLFGMSNKGTKVQRIGILGTVGLGILYLFNNNSLTTGAAMAVAPLVLGTVKDTVMNKIQAIKDELQSLKQTEREALQKVSLAEGECILRFFVKAADNGLEISKDKVAKLKEQTKLNHFFKWEEGEWVRRSKDLASYDRIEGGLSMEETHLLISNLSREELVSSVKEAVTIFRSSEERTKELVAELDRLQKDDMESYVETLHGMSNIYGNMHHNLSDFFKPFRTKKALADDETEW